MKLKQIEKPDIESDIVGFNYLDEPASESDKPFSTISTKEDITGDDIYELRKWKNSVIDMRDKHKGKFLYKVFDDESKRIIIFLNKYS